ncbi:little elongation complex subunit 1 isoform X2 [Megalops cyprinoides]|nr:little elongation complex subunit 1 isoform X2 [Megalops cyprinoides]
MYQQTSVELGSLKEESAKSLALNKQLENQLKKLEDSTVRQNHEIIELKMEKKKLEKNLHKAQKHLEKLAKEIQKNPKTISTQTSFPEEQKIDKAKVKLLFEELWKCIEPLSSHTTDPPFSSGYSSGLTEVPPHSQSLLLTTALTQLYSQPVTHTQLSIDLPCESSVCLNKSVKPFPSTLHNQGLPEPTNTGTSEKKTRVLGGHVKDGNLQVIAHENVSATSPCGNHGQKVMKILDWFRPLPQLLSPVSPQEVLFQDLSDSRDHEENARCDGNDLKMTICSEMANNSLMRGTTYQCPEPAGLQHYKLAAKQATDTMVMAAPAHQNTLQTTAFAAKAKKTCQNSGSKTVPPSEIEICEHRTKKLANTAETTVSMSDESMVDMSAESSTHSCVTVSVFSGVSAELSVSENTASFKNSFLNADDRAEKTSVNEKEINIKDDVCENALPVFQNGNKAEEQKGNCDTPPSTSILKPKPSTPIENMTCQSSEDLEVNEDTSAPFQTPLGFGNLEDSFSNGFPQKQVSDGTERQTAQSTLNYIIKDDTKTEQAVSKVISDVTSQTNEVGTVAEEFDEAKAVHFPHEMISCTKDSFQVSAGEVDFGQINLPLKSTNDETDKVKKQVQDGSHMEIPASTDTTLTSGFGLELGLTTSEQPTRELSPKEELHTVEIVYIECPSKLSKHEKSCKKAAGKTSELEVTTFTSHEVGCLKQIDYGPAERIQITNPSKILTARTDEDDVMRMNAYCSDVNPFVIKTGLSPLEFPTDEDKLERCSSEDPATHRESSDEQESFVLQRKVKTTYQRAGSQASIKTDNGVIRTGQNSTENHTAPGRSHCSCSSITALDHLPSYDSSHVKMDLSLNSVQLEDNGDNDVPIQKTFTGLSCCESKIVNDHQYPFKEKLKEYTTVVNQSQKITGECIVTSRVSAVSVAKTGPHLQRTDGSTVSHITQEFTDEKLEDMRKTFNSENIRLFPMNSDQTFKNPAIPSHNRQHSGNVQERQMVKLKDEQLILTNAPVLDTADTSTPIKSPESIRTVRVEMGPPLPPLLHPLTATPPRSERLESRIIPGKLSFPSPLNELISPLLETPLMSPLSDGSKEKYFTTPSPLDAKQRVFPSPLQFCARTPKHALPVPGRLPPSASAVSSSVPSTTQENSVTILDSMYPELSARARTLNILRGAVNLSRRASDSGRSVPDSDEQIARFKAIGLSTAFTKTGKAVECENSRFDQSIENLNLSRESLRDAVGQTRKRIGVNVRLPRSAKKARVDRGSPVLASISFPEKSEELIQQDLSEIKEDVRPNEIYGRMQMGSTASSSLNAISEALTKIETSCFDVLPVIHSHVNIGRVSNVPVLRDEEKEVIHEFCVVNKLLTDDLLSAIQMKMKTEKTTLSGNHMQALCRVYTGICRQRGDWERAHLFAYSILKEDFPDSAKLILFMVTTWNDILLHTSVGNRAIHAVVRLKASGEVLHCLAEYLGWKMNPPCEIQKLIALTLAALKTGVQMKFIQHDRHGDDLDPAAWEYIFTLDLLCSQQGWKWTHDNVICKELWPIMNQWVLQPRSQQRPVPDVSVASVLRLIGRLGQLGIKQKSIGSVRNVAKVMNMFGRHGRAEGVPWPVQLAAIYTIYDLSPSNPKEALQALAAWRGEANQAVPPAITSCITQIGSMCRYIKS